MADVSCCDLASGHEIDELICQAHESVTGTKRGKCTIDFKGRGSRDLGTTDDGTSRTFSTLDRIHHGHIRHRRHPVVVP